MPKSAMKDTLLLLRDGATAGNLTATETTGTKAVKGTPLGGMSMVIYVPSAGGTSPTLNAKIQHGDASDGSDAADLAPFPQITAAGTYRRRFMTLKEYVRVVLTVGGTSPNFGAVDVYPTVWDLPT